MNADRAAAWTTGIGLLLGVGYLFAGLVGWIVDVADGDRGDLAFWLVLLVGGGAALLAGLFYSGLPRGVALVLAVVGALAGALALLWSILVPLLAIVFVILLVLRERRSPAMS
jgi:hypothetical protein